MKRRLPLLLCCSILLNLGLASMLLRGAAPSDSDDLAAVLAQGGTDARLKPVPPAGDAAAAESKAAMLFEIRYAALEAARQRAAQYWSTDGAWEIEYGRALLAAQDRVRDELIGRYGPSATSDIAFRDLFRPLDPLYLFLTSDQQLAVQRLRFERDAGLRAAGLRAAGPGRDRTPAAAGPSGSTVQQASERYQAALVDLLDEPTLTEFLLRDSALAQQLRASGVHFSEDEFRSAFSVLRELEGGAPDIDAALAARRKLRDILGDRRFAKVWSIRDPLFARLAAVTASHAVDPSTADAVYEIMTEFEDARMRAAALSRTSPERAANETRRLAREERDRIARLVGEDVAADILASRAVESFRRFSGSMDRDAR